MLTPLSFLLQPFRDRKILLQLVKYDFRNDHLGSYLGIIWAFVNPLIYTMLLWFVFSIGFKSQPVKDVPFIVWLDCGLFPWLFISQGISAGTSSVTSQSYLVRKMVFRVELLPPIKILSAGILHLFFIGLIFIFLFSYGMPLSIHILQLPYYMVCTLILLLGISWLTSAVAVFVRDLTAIVGIAVQFGFWATPVFWSPRMLPEYLQPWLKINPFYYIVNGYRSCFITHEWFWEDTTAFLLFWGVTLFFLIFGSLVFRRLRPHFADVL